MSIYYDPDYYSRISGYINGQARINCICPYKAINLSWGDTK